MDGCGTVDPRNVFIEGLFLLVSPFIALWLLGLFLYCKLTGKIFLEAEQVELEEAKFQYAREQEEEKKETPEK